MCNTFIYKEHCQVVYLLLAYTVVPEKAVVLFLDCFYVWEEKGPGESLLNVLCSQAPRFWELLIGVDIYKGHFNEIWVRFVTDVVILSDLHLFKSEKHETVALHLNSLCNCQHLSLAV